MSLNETITRKKIKRTPKNIAVNNIEIPKGTYTWRNQFLPQKNKIFTDDLFLPSKENLCKLNNSGKWDLPEDIDEDDLYNWECIKWERPENIFLSEDYQVFYDKIENSNSINVPRTLSNHIGFQTDTKKGENRKKLFSEVKH